MKRLIKRFVIVLALCLAVVGVMAAPAMASALKVPLNPIGTDPGGGFVIFNDTSGPDNLQIQMSLKGALPNSTYEVYVNTGGSDFLAGTVTTNPQGNANFHFSGSWTGPASTVGLGLQRPHGVWQFGTGPQPYP